MSDTEDSEDEEEISAIVIANGSGWTKAGFAGDDGPTAVFPSIVGRPRHQGVIVDTAQKDCYVGDEALTKGGILRMIYPVQRGIVRDWDSMEKIWHHAFYDELRVYPEEWPVLTTRYTLNPKANTQKLIEIMFETFNVPSIYVSDEPKLSLYASGRTTGMVLHSGDGITTSTPIWEGNVLPHAVNRLKIAGKDITEYLQKLLHARGYSFTPAAGQEIVTDIKEKLGYTALYYGQEMAESKRDDASLIYRKYKLPDGQEIDINEERFQCGEVMFKPYMLGQDEQGIHEMIYDSIMECDIDVRHDFFQNIVLSGGNMMFKGMDDRLLKEMNNLTINRCQHKYKLIDGYLRQKYDKYICPEIGQIIYNQFNDRSNVGYRGKINIENKMLGFRQYAPFIGGSILSSLSSFDEQWFDKYCYDECGPSGYFRNIF